MSDYEDWSEEENDCYEDEILPPELSKCVSYEILEEKDIKTRQIQAIQKLSDEFGLEYSQSAVFLIEHNWNPQRVIEKLLDSSLQLPELSRCRSKTYNLTTLDCPSCYLTHPQSEVLGMDCGHYLCRACYKNYLVESINQGVESIFTKCPMPDCPLLVAQELFEKLVGQSSLNKYKKFLIDSFVNNRVDVKWCPSPDCKNAAMYPKKKAREISCSCGYSWCFGCGKETHRPLSCEMFLKWSQKLTCDDTEKWIMANTKTCPKCKNPIEKNLGCMHMTCKCGHEFCWLCMDDWSSHGSGTGGYYNCNKFNADRQKGVYKAEESRRAKLAYELQRFEHYYNRYLNHKASLAKAKYKTSITKDIVSVMYSKIREGQIFDFYLDAAEIVYQSKRSLAYTYALGYFLHSANKIRFFEFIQGELEKNMIRLEEMIEKDITQYLNEDDPRNCYLEPGFTNYRMEVIDLTMVVKRYFEECLGQIEAGFPEVKEDNNEEEAEYEVRDINFSDKWMCTACTLANDLSVNVCVACHSERLIFN